MEILETFVHGKWGDPGRCEDMVVVTGTHVAVIDGVTDKSGALFDGATGGRFAAQQVAAAIEALPAHIAAVAAVELISRALDDAIREALGDDVQIEDRPGAVVAVLDVAALSLWRVGDCAVRIDDVVHGGGKDIDRVTSEFRSAVLATYPDDVDGDPGREEIRGLLRRQQLLANRAGPFSYGVLNGTSVPDEHVEVFDVTGAHELVLATDGYPEIPSTLETAEKVLADALAEDPRCVGRLLSTKGVEPGADSFDDRAWVRIRL